MNTMPEWPIKENLRAFIFMTLPLLDQNDCSNNYYCAERLLFDLLIKHELPLFT